MDTLGDLQLRSWVLDFFLLIFLVHLKLSYFLWRGLRLNRDPGLVIVLAFPRDRDVVLG